jgi:hypothetical protein
VQNSTITKPITEPQTVQPAPKLSPMLNAVTDKTKRLIPRVFPYKKKYQPLVKRAESGEIIMPEGSIMKRNIELLKKLAAGSDIKPDFSKYDPMGLHMLDGKNPADVAKMTMGRDGNVQQNYRVNNGGQTSYYGPATENPRSPFYKNMGENAGNSDAGSDAGSVATDRVGRMLGTLGRYAPAALPALLPMLALGTLGRVMPSGAGPNETAESYRQRARKRMLYGGGIGALLASPWVISRMKDIHNSSLADAPVSDDVRNTA